MSELVAYLLVFLLAATPFFEMVAVIPLGKLYGLHLLPVTVLAFFGNLLTVLLVIVLMTQIKAWLEKRRKAKGKEISSKRENRAKRIWQRYGIIGLSILGPIAIGSHLAVMMAMSFGGTKKQTGFYMTVSLVLWVDGHQVWWIQNQWFGYQFTDPIVGYRTVTEPIIPSLNHVFPSMHTSIATVVILLALREKSKFIKYFFTILNIGIIFSTVYLGIHWVIDIFGGILFGVLTLKLVDKMMEKDWKNKWNTFEEKVHSYMYPLQDYRINHHSSHSFFWWDNK